MGLREMASRLWLPRSQEAATVCSICGDQFPGGADGEAARVGHVVACVKANEAELVGRHPRQKMPSFFASADPEYERYIKRKYGTD